MEVARKVRCEYESDLFPREDFEATATYGLVHTKNLEEGVPRHTKTGRVIDWGERPGVGQWVSPLPSPPPPDNRWVSPPGEPPSRDFS